MMHDLELRMGGFSFGEKTCMASYNLPTAKIELERAFDNLAGKIGKIPANEKETTILETADLARRFLNAVEWFEHVNALATAYDNEQKTKQGFPTQ
jgi:hypothetical protein